jgi:uncharacterized membrane protein YdbT with pleckstrin-like domain
MWDIQEKYLQKDEKVEYSDKPSKFSCFFSYAWVGLMLFSTIMMSLTDAFAQDQKEDLSSITISYFIMAIPGIYIILKRLSTRYAITNKGLITRMCIITNNVKTVPFKHITSIEVKESILGRIFRYSHLLVDTAGSGVGIEQKWKFVSTAHKVKRLIETKLFDES